MEDLPAPNEEKAAVAAEPALAQAIKKAKKKKKKPKKLSAKQKALEKLEKSAAEFLKDPVRSNNLFQTVAAWLRKYDKIVFKTLNQQCIYALENEYNKKNLGIPNSSDEEDEDGNDIFDNSTNIISYDDFKIVNTDLGIPCTHLELHALCKLLDPEMEGCIEYKYFNAVHLESYINHREIDGIRLVLKSEKNPNPKMNSIVYKNELSKHFTSDYPLYIKLDLRLLALGNDKEYKGHIKSLTIHTHVKIFDLIDMIKDKVDIASNKISIYRDITIESIMDEDKTLKDYGYKGRDYNIVLNDKQKNVFFYDYEILDNKDPILLSDFYFHDYQYTPPSKSEKSHRHRTKN